MKFWEDFESFSKRSNVDGVTDQVFCPVTYFGNPRKKAFTAKLISLLQIIKIKSQNPHFKVYARVLSFISDGTSTIKILNIAHILQQKIIYLTGRYLLQSNLAIPKRSIEGVCLLTELEYLAL